MTFLDELSQAVQSAASVWHQFTVAHDPQRDDWYIFVEGKLDAPFYTSAFRPLVGPSARIVGFRCNGKRGVLKARQDIRKTHPHCSRVLFFADKDLDDLLGLNAPPAENDFFCTTSYSIENYLVTEEALEVVWSQIWSMPSNDPTWPVIQQRFSDALKAFYALLIPIMAWVVLARRAGAKPNLNNLRMSSILTLDDCVPRLKREALMALIRETSCDYRPSLAKWMLLSRQLRGMSPKNVVRGKFELWLFCEFLHAISDALSSRVHQAPHRSIPPSLDGIALSILGKVKAPIDLLEFLNNALVTGAFGHCPTGS